MDLALAPRTIVFKQIRSFTEYQSAYHEWCFGRIHEYAGAAVMLVRGVEVSKNEIRARFHIVKTQQSG
eukprot:2018349-Pyramimonas_sp.AAC.1